MKKTEYFFSVKSNILTSIFLDDDFMILIWINHILKWIFLNNCDNEKLFDIFDKYFLYLIAFFNFVIHESIGHSKK